MPMSMNWGVTRVEDQTPHHGIEHSPLYNEINARLHQKYETHLSNPAMVQINQPQSGYIASFELRHSIHANSVFQALHMVCASQNHL